MANFSTKIASTVTASALVASAMGTSFVSAASEFLPYAELLATNKVIGTQATEAGYRLNDQITRAELAKVAANLGQYTAVKCTGTVYADVTTSLGDLCDAIETLAAAKVVSTNNTNFRPTANVTRAEMTKMLLGALGEKPSATSAGYTDVTSALGDLAGFINRANELKCANTATYFRPQANSSRGEAFKIASCAAGLKPTTTTTTATGAQTVVNTGNLTISTVGSATAQYVPLNASTVKVGTIKVTATGGDAIVNTLTVTRSGLGEIRGLKASLAQNGVIVGNARTFNTTTQESVIRLNSPLTLKNGTSVEFDVLASLPENGTSNSQHQFAVSGTNGSAITPVTLGLLNTTSYSVGTVTADALTTHNQRSGLTNVRIADLSITGISGRDTTVHGFTISKNKGNNLTDAIANVKVFRNGVDTGATATVTSDKIIVTGLHTKLTAGELAKYTLHADTIYVGDDGNYELYVANTEDIAATENQTGYTTRVTNNAETPRTLTISGIKVTTSLVDTTTKNIAPGASSVNILDGKITSSASFEVLGYTLTPYVNGAAATATQIEDIFSSLAFDVAGTNYDLKTTTLNSGKYTFGSNDSFILDAGKDVIVRVRGTVKPGVNTTTYKNVKFVFETTRIKNIENGNSFAFSKDLAGNTVNIKSSTLEVRAASVAAPSTKNISSTVNGVEIGRVGLEAKNAEVRVAKITVTNASTSNAIANLTSLADNASSFRLVDLSTGTEIDANKEFTAGNAGITFEFAPALTVAKDQIKNLKLTVDTKAIDEAEMGKTFQAKFDIVADDLSTDNGTVSATDLTETNAITYTAAISMPTLQVTPVTLSANSAVANVRVTNTDSDNYVQVKEMKVRIQARSTASNSGAFDFANAQVCLRNQGATVACDVAAEVIAGNGGAVNGAVYTFTFSDVISAGKAISTTSSADFEVYLNNAPLWVAGDFVAVSIDSAKYAYGTTTAPTTEATDTYVGVASATATSNK